MKKKKSNSQKKKISADLGFHIFLLLLLNIIEIATGVHLLSPRTCWPKAEILKSAECITIS